MKHTGPIYSALHTMAETGRFKYDRWFPPEGGDCRFSRMTEDEGFVSEGAKHADFKIGTEFQSGTGKWRVTDIGTRTVIAIKLEHDDNPTMYKGPPYKIVENVWDEYDFGGLTILPGRKEA